MVIRTSTGFESPQLNTRYTASAVGVRFTRIASPSVGMIEKWINLQTAAMIEGYQTIASENLKLAEENMSIVLETWPEWE